jgi:phenylacetate-CoA ligase
LPAFRLGEADITASIRALSRHKPTLIEGPTETLEAFAAQHAQGGGLEHFPKAMLVYGQKLTDSARSSISSAFNCKVFDLYRTGELGELACETGEGSGLCLAAEGYIVEVLVGGRTAAGGETGEVYVTDLNNRCMPFVRYATGDRAVALPADATEPHPRGFPRLGALSGRPSALFSGVSGERVPSGFFSALLSEYSYAVRRFTIAQPAPGVLALRLEKAPRYAEATLDLIKARVRERLGEGLEFDVQLEEPAREASSPHASPRPAAVRRV